MGTIPNYKVLAKANCIEELESRIVFDGAIDEAPHTDSSMASAIAGGDGGSRTAAHTDGHHEGSETLGNGTTHYWAEDWSGQNGGRYDHYWYTNGTQGWAYEGQNWDSNGNGWQYAGDSAGAWDYTGVELSSASHGWEYTGNDTGTWTYHGYDWSAGLGWEYAGKSEGQWYYENVFAGSDGGTGHYVGNYTGYETFDYTFTNGTAPYHNASGVGTDWNDACWTGYWSYNYNYEGGNGNPWSVDPVVINPTSPNDVDSQIENWVLYYANQYRQQPVNGPWGIPPVESDLIFNSNVDLVAEQHLQDILNTHVWAHESGSFPAGWQDLEDRFSNVDWPGWGSCQIGENLSIQFYDTNSNHQLDQGSLEIGSVDWSGWSEDQARDFAYNVVWSWVENDASSNWGHRTPITNEDGWGLYYAGVAAGQGVVVMNFSTLSL
jgi:hypothetical protein